MFKHITEESGVVLTTSKGRELLREALDGQEKKQYFKWKREWYAKLPQTLDKSKKDEEVKQWSIPT
jgi:hypothetical protein